MREIKSSKRKTLTEKVLEDDDSVKFVSLTKEYGNAEFAVCSVYARGKLRKLYLYPHQQPNAKHFYRIDVPVGTQDWSIGSWTHKGIDEPHIWLHYWCKEHKAPAIRLYVPKGTTKFTVSKLSNLSINFDL